MPIRYITPDLHPAGLMAQSSFISELDNDTYTNGTSGFTITRPVVAAGSRKTQVAVGPDGRKWFELSGASKLCINCTGPTSGVGTAPSLDATTTQYTAVGFRVRVDDLNDLVGIHLSCLGSVRSHNGMYAYYGIPAQIPSWLQSNLTSVGEYYVEVRQYQTTPASNVAGTSRLYVEVWIDGVPVTGASALWSDQLIDINTQYFPVINMTSVSNKLIFRDVYTSYGFLNSAYKPAKSLNIKAKAYRAKAISGYPNDLTEISNNLINGAVNTRHDTLVANTLPTQLTGLGGQVDLTLDHDPTRLRGTPVPIFRYGRVSGVDTAVEVKSLVDSSVVSSVANTPTPGVIVGAVNLTPPTIDPTLVDKLKDVRVKFTQFVGGA